MSDFNRDDPAYRPADPRINDPLVREPVTVEKQGSAFGVLAGIAVAVLVAIGGFYLFTHSDSVKTAANDTVTTSASSPPSAAKPMDTKPMDNGSPATTSPQLNPTPAPKPPVTPSPAQ